jgi:F0F1-type ATP synthase alpha subunit
MAKKQDLLAEKEKLQKELSELGSVSESQVYHKKARISQIDVEISELEKKQFDKGNDKLKSMMEQQNKHGLTQEQMAMINATKKEF